MIKTTTAAATETGGTAAAAPARRAARGWFTCLSLFLSFHMGSVASFVPHRSSAVLRGSRRPPSQRHSSSSTTTAAGQVAPASYAATKMTTTSTTSTTSTTTAVVDKDDDDAAAIAVGDEKDDGQQVPVSKSGLTDAEEEILFGEDSVPDSTARPQAAVRPLDRFGNVLPDPRHRPPNALDHAVSDPLINKLHTMRSTLTSCPAMWTELAKHCPDRTAVLDEHLCDGGAVNLTFAEMERAVAKSAAVFAAAGVTKGKHVAVLGENSARWLQIDHGVQAAGGASAVRGADAPADELRYIYEHSDSAGIAVLQGPKLFRRLASDAESKGLSGLGLSNDRYGPVRTVIFMHREKKTDDEIAAMGRAAGVDAVVFDTALEKAQPAMADQLPALTRDDVATIVYTSGTTGHPKGSCLTHGNLLHQAEHRLSPETPYEDAEPVPGDCMLALLPVWHITERAFEIWMATRGCRVVYSSVRTFKSDLAKHRPQWLVLVPRVLEKVAAGVQEKLSAGGAAAKALSKLFTATGSAAAKHRKIARGLTVGDERPNDVERFVSKGICAALAPVNYVGNKLVWSKVQAGFGGRLKVIIAGGSALAGGLETFYETAGINICVGYGLTECSPLVSFRRGDSNLVAAGCVGAPASETTVRVVDPDGKAVDHPRPSLPAGEVGVVIAKGPQVMKGYYKDVAATAAAIDKFGWFDTGDLGRINPATGDLILTGRAKDTIVLSNGENVEPTPLEDAILGESTLIEQVMLTGQDGRKLTAIVVLTPTELGNAAYVSRDEAAALQEAHDTANDPKCTPEDSKEACAVLRSASVALRKDANLVTALTAAAQKATSKGDAFRKWEKVNDVYLTLEPFAMSNGQLTQSYKVKRGAVTERYQDELK